MSSENILEIKNLVKAYDKKLAVKNLNLSVDKGLCFGLLGPNGAGKSTTMKIITGIINYDSGSVKLFDMEISKNNRAASKFIGYVPQEITLYEKLNAYDNLTFFGELYGLKGENLKRRINEVLLKVDLKEHAKEYIRTFSGGMKRRINIAAALLHSPKLLILDEPTVGVDPQSRNHIFNLIKELKQQGTSIIYSTHYMEEAEALCDKIAIIDNGSVIAQGSLEEILSIHGKSAVYVEVDQGAFKAPIMHSKNMYTKGKGFVIESEHLLETIRDISDQAIKKHINISDLAVLKPSLENIFLDLTGTSLRD